MVYSCMVLFVCVRLRVDSVVEWNLMDGDVGDVLARRSGMQLYIMKGGEWTLTEAME